MEIKKTTIPLHSTPKSTGAVDTARSTSPSGTHETSKTDRRGVAGGRDEFVGNLELPAKTEGREKKETIRQIEEMLKRPEMQEMLKPREAETFRMLTPRETIREGMIELTPEGSRVRYRERPKPQPSVLNDSTEYKGVK